MNKPVSSTLPAITPLLANHGMHLNVVTRIAAETIPSMSDWARMCKGCQNTA